MHNQVVLFKLVLQIIFIVIHLLIILVYLVVVHLLVKITSTFDYDQVNAIGCCLFRTSHTNEDYSDMTPSYGLPLNSSRKRSKRKRSRKAKQKRIFWHDCDKIVSCQCTRKISKTLLIVLFAFDPKTLVCKDSGTPQSCVFLRNKPA